MSIKKAAELGVDVAELYIRASEYSELTAEIMELADKVAEKEAAIFRMLEPIEVDENGHKRVNLENGTILGIDEEGLVYLEMAQ